MKKKTGSRKSIFEQDAINPEYDLRGVKGVRGKYDQAMRKAYTVTIHKNDGTVVVKEIKTKGTILLDPDIQKYFPDSKTVNNALRSMIASVPLKHTVKTRERQAKYSLHRVPSMKKTNR